MNVEPSVHHNIMTDFVMRYGLWIIPLATWLLLYMILSTPLPADLASGGGNRSAAFANLILSRTEPDEELLNRRILQNHLSQIITDHFDTIDQAAIVIAKPDDRDGRACMATVKLHCLVPISQEHIKNIQRWIANSVPELIEENVVVLDQNNVLLSSMSTKINR